MIFELNKHQERLRQQAKSVAVSKIAPRAAEVDATEQYPWDNVAVLTDNGFMGMTVPSDLGGAGRSYLDTVLVVEEMAKVCGITGRIVVEGNMGAIGATIAYGSPEQRELAARHVLSGDKPAICITEPDAGSAATDMTTTAVKHGDHYVLNGTKHWITGGGVSRLHLIFARGSSRTGSNAVSRASLPFATRTRASLSAAASTPWDCAEFRRPKFISAI